VFGAACDTKDCKSGNNKRGNNKRGYIHILIIKFIIIYCTVGDRKYIL